MVKVLLSQEYEVHTFGRKPVEGTVFHPWDAINEPKDYGIQLDAIIHCAASATDWGNDDLIRKINVEGTRSALAICPTARFIHVSTASVYASKGDSLDITENKAVSGTFLNAYSESKLEAEKVAEDDGREAGVYILRPHAVYGPGDTTLLPRIEEALRGRFLPLPNGGNSLVSLTRVESFVAVMMDLIEYSGSIRQGVFNIADREPVVLAEALKEIMNHRRTEVKVISLPSSLAWTLGHLMEIVAKKLNLRRPPLTRYLVSQLGYAETLDLSAIEELLGINLPTSDFKDASRW
jgi:nucleoside-diphosphate-sugar epimerase